MKIQAAYDGNGHILTAVSRAPSSGHMVSIAPQDGAEVAEFDVPEEYANKPLREFLHLLRVDRATKKLVVHK